MQGPVSRVQGLFTARAGGRLGFFAGRYLKYLATMVAVSSFCYPAGSRKWLSRRFKWLAMSALRASSAQPWLRAVASCSLLQRVVAARPLLLEKPYRPLGAWGLGFVERARLVQEHYAVMHAALPVAVCERIYLSGGLEWPFAEGRYTLRLSDPGPNPKEGELAFYWIDNETGASLTQLSFYLRFGAMGPDVFVGGLQGPMNEASREWIRAATKTCEGLRPKDVVMEALLAFASHLGARRIVAVSRANHVGRQRNTPREIQCDYESFWAEYHGVPTPDGNLELPVRQPVRDIAEIASKKRSAWRRKQAVAEAVRTAVLVALTPDTAPTANDAEPAGMVSLAA
ncbi:VirK/YbjX family protein [Cupriavidus agavae]|uniref:DUF535 domain-containing protein n=1 Tax=Cupriavidus agavae TaxID=1001822 RepID=A0A4Q7REU2_9BURK|nr:VirK/YbjX family protein [Cupriavidus agavae]RZT30878.1 hypothetical protein EV147_4726 [Cupriavidus agavae]